MPLLRLLCDAVNGMVVWNGGGVCELGVTVAVGGQDERRGGKVEVCDYEAQCFFFWEVEVLVMRWGGAIVDTRDV